MEELLSRYGSQTIRCFRVYREPLMGAVRIAAQSLALGQLPRQLYHVFFVFQLNNVAKVFVRVDKNEIVDVQYLPAWPKGQNITVFPQTHITLTQFFNRGEAQNPNHFWEYDARDANCQDFVRWCLKGNNLLSPVLEHFFYQGHVPIPSLTGKIFKGITRFASHLSRAARKAKHATRTIAGKKRRR
jgi:hypothetical protein